MVSTIKENEVSPKEKENSLYKQQVDSHYTSSSPFIFQSLNMKLSISLLAVVSTFLSTVLGAAVPGEAVVEMVNSKRQETCQTDGCPGFVIGAYYLVVRPFHCSLPRLNFQTCQIDFFLTIGVRFRVRHEWNVHQIGAKPSWWHRCTIHLM